MSWIKWFNNKSGKFVGDYEMKEYEEFKQFIKSEIVKAVDDEDSERIKYLLSALELMIQMKKKNETSESEKPIKAKIKVKEIKAKKKVPSKTLAKKSITTEKKTAKKPEKKVGKQGHTSVSLGEKASSKKKAVLDKAWTEEENPSVNEEPLKKYKEEEVVVLHQEVVKEQETPAVEQPKEKTESKSSSGKRLPFTGKLDKGLKTPQSAYIYPLLDTLMEFNGSAQYSVVVQKIYEKMKDIFNSYDLSPVTHNKYIPRWKDTLKWVRVDLVNRGILEKNTEKGIWAITDYGKAYYAQHKEKFEGKNAQSSEEVKKHDTDGSSQQTMLDESASDNAPNLEEVQGQEVGVGTSQLISEEVQGQEVGMDTPQSVPEESPANIPQSSQDVGHQTIGSDFSHSEPEQNSQ